MTKQLIGTAVTDENGIATLQYKCAGRGKFQITAESGALVSTPYPVLDALAYDTGIDGTATDIWTVPSDTTLTRGEEYSTWKKTVTSNKYLPKSFTATSDVCFEFEVYQVTGFRTSRIIQISNSDDSSTYYATLQDLGGLTENWVTVKLELKNGKVYLNGTDTGNTFSFTPSKFYFILYGTSMTEIRFRNFKAYPI